MIRYGHDPTTIASHQLTGFFQGWPDPPSAERHLALMRGSAAVVLAMDDERAVGFITAISDGVLSAFIPLLEVLPAYRGRGIGSELVRRMLDRLDQMYMVDVVFDEDLSPFYERLGFTPGRAGLIRHRRNDPAS